MIYTGAQCVHRSPGRNIRFRGQVLRKDVGERSSLLVYGHEPVVTNGRVDVPFVHQELHALPVIVLVEQRKRRNLVQQFANRAQGQHMKKINANSIQQL